MILEEGIFSHLSGNAAVSALVASRIHPVTLPQSVTFPALSYRRISGQRVNHLAGSSGLQHPRIQMSAWSKTYSQAKNITENVRLSLEGFRGTMGTIQVDGVVFLGDHDLYEDETELYHIASDFEIWAHEPKP
ncbi:MAG: DUF3168 domain-containing protein [Phycisphaeraceae bacterium]|nr:DUF3168 domain-containing protein [Phycisphaeraceae bacterium]